MDRRPFLRAVLACLAGLLLAAGAQAQVFRAYLSSAGVDNAACGVATPCRLLPAALAAVADGGEIWMLNSANYNTGPVAITKSVTILAVPGALGSVVALGGDAIVIATPSVKVALRNLVIVPFLGNVGNGINMTAGAALTVQDCLIANLVGTGIQVSTAATVRVTDTTIRDNSGDGLTTGNGSHTFITRSVISGHIGGSALYAQGAAGITTVDVADSVIEANLYGLIAYSGGFTVRLSVADSRIIGNTNWALAADASGSGVAYLSAGNNRISNNGSGILATSGGAKVWASGNVVSHNDLGLEVSGGAIFESAGDNAVRNNGTNSFGTITVLPKL